VVPVKVYLNASAHCDEAFPNTTFHATEMAGGSVLGSTRSVRVANFLGLKRVVNNITGIFL
jgi:hypothetical protein